MEQTNLQKKTTRIALLGNTGVGKGTFATFLEEMINDDVHRIRLAKPLYDAQEQIYKICQVPKSYEVQDGELLNFLGAHMRKINPHVLEDTLKETVATIQRGVVICDDARPKDLGYLKESGFLIVEIVTNERIAQARRELRGDISLGSSKHSTETGYDSAQVDITIVNESSLDDFRAKAKKLIESLL